MRFNSVDPTENKKTKISEKALQVPAATCVLPSQYKPRNFLLSLLFQTLYATMKCLSILHLCIQFKFSQNRYAVIDAEINMVLNDKETDKNSCKT